MSSSYNSENSSHPIYEPLSDQHAEYIKSLVKMAAEQDPEFHIFGSSSHQYQLNPVLSIEEVRNFEKQYHLHLPEEYVFFLTKVGNGGAGPYYGLYSLSKAAAYTENLDIYTDEDIEGCPPVIDQNLTADAWAEMMKEDDENVEPEISDALWDQTMKRVCSGILTIGTQGCTYDNLLMWKGSEKGKIVYIDWNLDPDYKPYLTGFSFLKWYESYFQEIIAGHNLNSYGYYSLNTEKELIRDYHDAQTLEEKAEVLLGFYKFTQVEPETITFLIILDEPKLDAMRTELLFNLDSVSALQVFELLLNGKNQQAAVNCCRKIPENQKNQYYSSMLQLLYKPEIENKSRLLYFLNDCSLCCAKDIKDFAMDASQPEDYRKTAIYVMGQCQDKIKFISEFITLMKGSSYWLAHTALQAMARTQCSELIDTYEWMWNQYKEDSTMSSNLRIAFEHNGIRKN